MPRGDRQERRKQNAEHDARMRQLQEQWLSNVQQRQIRAGDAPVDRSSKTQTHGASMMERMQRMQIERVRLAMEVAKHKVQIADMWLKNSKDREQLYNMRTARKEWDTKLRKLKRDLYQAKRLATKINDWAEDMEVLIYGAHISPRQLSAGWRAFFCLIGRLDRETQRKISQLPLADDQKGLNNLSKPGDDPDFKFPAVSLKSNDLFGMLKFCQRCSLVPASGSRLQSGLFQAMEIIDKSLAALGGEHEAFVEKHKSELDGLNLQSWKTHKVI